MIPFGFQNCNYGMYGGDVWGVFEVYIVNTI